MEQLREEQGKLLLRQMNDILLRQNVRTAGRTYHTERLQQGSAADSDPGPFITILIHVCLQCPTFCTFSFILEICTRAFCPIFCMGACPSCAICIVVAMQTSVFLRGHVFGLLSLMLCSSFGQRICQIHFMIPAKLRGSHILLKPCSISCAQSFTSA